MCSKHYKARLGRGEYGTTDATPVAVHLRALRKLGWSLCAVEELHGLARSNLRRVARGDTDRVRILTARRVLAIPLQRPDLKCSVDALGTRRRVEALGRMGWTARTVSVAVGLKPATLSAMLFRGTVSMATANRVAEFYQQHSEGFGGNARFAAKARSLGYPPPSAWDEDTIDDPEARPNFTGFDEYVVRLLMDGEPVERPTRPDREEALARLLDAGLTAPEATRLIGVSAGNVYSYLRRAA
jgi:lambda repressor-like predicted transcriptional regulator